MSFVSRLVELITGVHRSSSIDDTLAAAEMDARLAAAALLVHVVRADGVLAETERDRVLEFLRSRFSLTPEQGGRLFDRADEADAAIDDGEALAQPVGHGPGPT